ncbi:SPW repeat domain-containing protein [Pontibacter pamirensis]|uniref:SPW repeat domain-containing protein n=1 Tax=Pontibacter pamirensis TaxID=2562824 RepID=UPI001389BB7E|nr:SPW repeat protein [Pontibacter pamirensis]
MRFIPTRFHGILDYMVGLLLLASPWLLGFSEIEAATKAAIIASAVVVVQAVVTDFEAGILTRCQWVCT